MLEVIILFLIANFNLRSCVFVSLTAVLMMMLNDVICSLLIIMKSLLVFFMSFVKRLKLAMEVLQTTNIRERERERERDRDRDRQRDREINSTELTSFEGWKGEA